ncbi:unnamed protein product [Adineta steineri]|uniref:Glucose-methanol-choline oxidoreductase N-terminal domain-containing protein n=1 Tax=Adineta steineri TaxID=433720 RepID=A0A814BH25_9BILA|nr:unnamed protein product [Adineta steineri]
MERMMAADWNSFVDATGDRSFAHESMEKYYKRVENFATTSPVTNSNIHGNDGPIKITQIYDDLFGDIWKKAADELDEIFNYDLSGKIDYGFSFEPSSFTNGLRSSSGDAYLIPAMAKYPNLKVITGATATKFIVNEITKEVNCVLFVSMDGFFSAVANKEYILSSGTFYSPHLLMLSGIGDPEILRQNGIEVKHKLEQVGKHLIDNGFITVEYETSDFPIGQSIPVALVNTQSPTTDTNPDIFFLLKTDNTKRYLYVIIFNASPRSSGGSISLYNSNPLIPPKITLNYLEDHQDILTFINGINYVRRVMSTASIKQFASLTEISPGMKDVDISTYIRNNLQPLYHFVGTCSMGKNSQNSVVDHRFKVHDIRNLRIVDASVFPAAFTSKTGPCLTVYALAEKLADILRQQYT